MNDLLYNVNKAVKKTVFINGNFDFTKIKNIKQINCGGFGCIYKIDYNNKQICIKISKSSVSNKTLSNILSDSKIKKQLNNFIPNVYETGQALIENKKYFYTVMDFINGDEIDNYELNNIQVIQLFIFLIKFMYILHKNNLAYTDMKPQNIMYDGNYFKIVDIDTIKHQWIYKNTENEITTDKYYLNKNKLVRNIHPLEQLSTCILTCLELLNMYPNCKVEKNNDNLKKKKYINAMIDFVEKNNIKSPMELENKITFHNLLMQLNKKTNNLAYSLLFLINIYIELIPKFTVAYINVNYVVNVLTYYMNFINNTNTGNELCNNVNKEHILIGKAYVDYSLLDNIEELINMIPDSINTDYYIKNIYPHYKEIINKKKKNNKFIYETVYLKKFKNIFIDDEYEYYRKDPKVIEHIPSWFSPIIN